jgi:hypothetical protein
MNSISIPENKFSGAIRPFASFLAVAGALALLAGCESPQSHVVSGPPPPNPVVVSPPVSSQPVAAQVVVTGAATPSGANTIIITQAPPAVQEEVQPPRPSSAYAWVPGYWTWRNNRYEWVHGHWEIPPRVDAVWVAPRTERLSDGNYRFHEGFWH